MKWLVATLLVAAAGCTPSGLTRQPAAARALRGSQQSYALGDVDIAGVRAGQLSASREWTRDGNRGIGRDDSEELRAFLVRDLSRAVRVDERAPIRVRATLTLQ